MQYFALMIPNMVSAGQNRATDLYKADKKPHGLGIGKVFGRNRNIGITYSKTELTETVGVLNLELSSGFDDSVILKGEKLRRLCRQIEDICRAEGCGRIIFPGSYPPFNPICENIPSVTTTNRCDFLQIGRKFLRIALPDLFRAYLEMYDLKYAEVLIIQDKNESGGLRGGSEAVNAIHMLSRFIKIAAVYNASPSEAGQIFTDTGIPVITPANIQSAAKSADIVINFCTDGGGIAGVKTLKLKKTAIIINLGDNGVNRLKVENPVVNGVRIGLPDSLRDPITGAREILRFFDLQMIAETILVLMANSSGLPDNFRDAAGIAAFVKYYKKAGFTVAGCYGRHGLLKEFLTIK